MSDEDEPRKGGCFRRILALAALALVAGLGVFAWFAFQPQDLGDLETSPPRNLATVLQNGRQGGYEVILSEGEINGFLARTLEAHQSGVFDDRVKIRGVRVRLEDDRAEIVIEREAFGRPNTVSMFVRIEQTQPEEAVVETKIHPHGGPLFEGFPVLVGGRFGQARVPQGFLLLVLAGFERLAEVYAPELAELGIVRDPSEARGLVPLLRIEDGQLRVSPPDAFDAP